MNAINAKLLSPLHGSLKFLLNDSGIAFFLASLQHRDMKMPGLSYEDDYRGNALAGIVTADHVEIRFHQSFSDERVRALWSQALALPELSGIKFGRVLYQGREIC